MQDPELERLQRAANDAASAWSAAVAREELAREAYARAHRAVLDYATRREDTADAERANAEHARAIAKRWEDLDA